MMLSRDTWGAKPPRHVSRLDWRKITMINVHWPGSTSAAHGDDLEHVRGLLRGWQRFHMALPPQGRGWSDIAYNVAVDQAGRLHELRGWHVRDGGVAGRDDDVTILAVLGAREEPTDAMQLSILAAMDEADRIKGSALTRSYHGAVTLPGRSRTACPGPILTGWARAGFPAPVRADAPQVVDPLAVGDAFLVAPPFPLGEGMWYGPRSSSRRQVSGWEDRKSDGSRGADGLARWQRRMVERGWTTIGQADGLWGDKTERVARLFQAEKGLPADGLVGLQTWDAAWSAPVTTA